MERLTEFATNHWELMAALVATIGLLIHNLAAPRFRRYKVVTPLEATRMINQDDAVVLDVCDTHEYNSGHILDAVHIPLAALPDRVDELDKYRERPIIVSCRTGTRSGGACGKLTKAGYSKVFSLRGGLAEWEQANLPIARGSKPKRKRK